MKSFISRIVRHFQGEKELDWHRGLANSATCYVNDRDVVAKWVNACGIAVGDWPRVEDPKPGDVFRNERGYRGIVFDKNYILQDDGEFMLRNQLPEGDYVCPLQGAWHLPDKVYPLSEVGVNNGRAKMGDSP